MSISCKDNNLANHTSIMIADRGLKSNLGPKIREGAGERFKVKRTFEKLPKLAVFFLSF